MPSADYYDQGDEGYRLPKQPGTTYQAPAGSGTPPPGYAGQPTSQVRPPGGSPSYAGFNLTPWTREFNPNQAGGGSYGSQQNPGGSPGNGQPGRSGGSATYNGGGSAADFVNQFADRAWVGNDPSYWTGVIAKSGGLTPENEAYWAQRMSDAPGQGSNAGGLGGGAGGSYDPMGQFNYSGPGFSWGGAPNVGSYTAGQYNAGKFNYTGPEFSWDGVADPGKVDAGQFQAPDQFNSGVPQFGYNDYSAMRYQQPDAFKAPTMDEALNDPGYQFRVAQGNDAIQKSAAARGTLLTGNTLTALQDYAQGAASQEYANVYGRRMDEYKTAAELGQGAYDRNYTASTGEYDRNYGKALTENQTAYNRAASEYDRNFNNAFQVNQSNANRRISEYQANTGAAQNAAQLRLQGAEASYDRNFGSDLQTFQANESAGLGAFQANEGAGLGAYQANTSAALNRAQLDLSGAQASYDRNYQQQLNQYQMEMAQRQFQAGYGLQNAQFGLQAQNQAYNQNLTTYNTNYAGYQNNQQQGINAFQYDNNQAYNASQGLNNDSQQYVDSQGNLITGRGNSQAAGYVARGNAYGDAVAGISNTAAQGIYYNQYGFPQQTTVPNATTVPPAGYGYGGGGYNPYPTPVFPPRVVE